MRTLLECRPAERRVGDSELVHLALEMTRSPLLL